MGEEPLITRHYLRYLLGREGILNSIMAYMLQDAERKGAIGLKLHMVMQNPISRILVYIFLNQVHLVFTKLHVPSAA